MRKIVFLEGLPGVGKTTIANAIKKINMKNVHVVDEIIKEDIINRVSDDENDYMLNDEMKISKYSDGLIVIDRGPISTLSYNQSKAIIDTSFDEEPVVEWFKKVQYIYDDNAYIIYLTTKGKSYKESSNDESDPFGKPINQELMESVGIYNCKKYCKNVKIIEYHKENMEEIINEIIA